MQLKYAIIGSLYGKIHIVLLNGNQKRIFEELSGTGEYLDDYEKDSCFYTINGRVVRDGDTGHYLSIEAEEIMLQLFDDSTIQMIGSEIPGSVEAIYNCDLLPL